MGSYVNRIKIGDTTHLIEPTLYGTCSTAAATAAKTVTLEGFELQSGVTVAVKFTVTNTAASPTLSINSSDAKAIYYHGSAIAKELLVANKIYYFVYDGSHWEIIGDLDTDTDTKVTQTAVGNTYTYWRPLLFGASNSSSEGFSPSTITNNVYATAALSVQPSTGTIRASIFKGSGESLTSLNASNISSGTLSADRLATSGATAGSYGPSAAVSGTDGTTMNVPYITVDNKVIVTGIENKVYTSVNTWRPIGTGATDAAAGNHNHDDVYLKRNSELLTTNPFAPASLKGPYISKIDNAFYAADKRWTVTASGLNAAVLFDGNYESQTVISAGNSATILMDFDPNHNNSAYFPGYPYGYILISFYYTSGPASITGRVYCNYSSHGIGWHDISFSPVSDNGSANIVYRSAHQGYFNISQLEITVTAPSSNNTGITQIEMHLDRPNSSYTPFLSKYAAETLYYDLTAPKFIGALQGNADTATKFNSTRKIELTGAVTGSATTDGSSGWTINTSVTVPVTLSRAQLINTEQMAFTNWLPKYGSGTAIPAKTMALFADGLAIKSPATANDAAWLRFIGTGEADSVLEIATSDDANNANAEKIVARQYNGSSAIYEAVLLGKIGDVYGATSFPVQITAPKFIGNLTGIADKAKAANLTTTANAVAYYTDTAGTFGTKASANGALYATSANGTLQWGTLPVAQGGTGATTAENARSNLGLGSMATETATNYLKWQTTSAASTALYDFGVYCAQNTAGGTGPGGSNYYNLINIPYRKASGNTKLDWGWQLGNNTANNNRLYYRTTGDNTAGNWQTIAHAEVSSNNIGSATQPVYMTSDGVITAGTAIGASAYHADNYFVKAITSTDNAIVRFDNTNGQVQNSGVTLNDNNILTFPNSNSGIRRVGRSVSWINGRDGALIATTSVSGYGTLASVKTTNGSWDIGAYDNGSYIDDLIFAYCKDTDYNASPQSNTTTAIIKFLENGHIVAALDGTASKATAANLTTTQYGIAYYSDTTGTFAGTGAGTSGQYLKSNGTSAPTWASFPSTWTPSAHNHNASDINAGTLAIARIADGSITNAKLENSKITIAGQEVSLGGSLTLANMGLSSAMHFRGKATVAITENSTTDPTINGYTFGANGASALAGDVILDQDSEYEYVWTADGTSGKWEKLGSSSSYALSNHNHDDTYLKLAGGKMTGPLTWKDNTALPEATTISYLLGIDAFANGGTTKWISAANARTAIGAAASGHTHTTTLTQTGTSTIDLVANTVYTLTAGGTSIVFKTPASSGHYTANIYTTGASGTSAVTTNTSDPYVALVENSTRRSAVQFKAGSNMSVSGNNGVITFTATNTWTAMTGASSSANGTVGYVNAVPPKDGYNTKFLRADGTWAVPDYIANVAYGNISTSGTINQSSGWTLASGDGLVVFDSSNSNKLERTGITFDASTETQCLTKKGTWKTFGTSNLTIGTTSTTAMAGNTVVTNVTHTKRSDTTTFYLTGTTSSATNTSGDIFDTGVYVTTTSGGLSAVRQYWNYSDVDKAYSYFNNTTQSIDFVFI